MTPGRTSSRAPVANETERAKLQQRLLVTLRMVLALSVGVWLLTMVAIGLSGVPLIWLIAVPESFVQFGICIAVFGIWWLVRTRKRSAGFLDIAAIVSTLLVCVAWIFLATYRAPAGRPDLFALFLITCTLALHAALVPSTALRTACVAVVAFVGLDVADYSAWSRNGLGSPGREVVFLALLSAAAVACVSTNSHVMYGCACAHGMPCSSANISSRRRSAKAEWASCTARSTRCSGGRPHQAHVRRRGQVARAIRAGGPAHREPPSSEYHCHLRLWAHG